MEKKTWIGVGVTAVGLGLVAATAAIIRSRQRSGLSDMSIDRTGDLPEDYLSNRFEHLRTQVPPELVDSVEAVEKALTGLLEKSGSNAADADIIDFFLLPFLRYLDNGGSIKEKDLEKILDVMARVFENFPVEAGSFEVDFQPALDRQPEVFSAKLGNAH